MGCWAQFLPRPHWTHFPGLNPGPWSPPHCLWTRLLGRPVPHLPSELNLFLEYFLLTPNILVHVIVQTFHEIYMPCGHVNQDHLASRATLRAGSVSQAHSQPKECVSTLLASWEILRIQRNWYPSLLVPRHRCPGIRRAVCMASLYW